jgi:hypothetical protein
VRPAILSLRAAPGRIRLLNVVRPRLRAESVRPSALASVSPGSRRRYSDRLLAKKIRTQVQYFEARKDRMRYAAFKRRGIPLGSGAVESGIRRVVNLRLKGASMFWGGENAERMLHMRAYYKAGRWDELMLRVLHASPSGACAAQVRSAAA